MIRLQSPVLLLVVINALTALGWIPKPLLVVHHPNHAPKRDGLLPQHQRRQHSAMTTTRRPMALVPLPVEDLEDLLDIGVPTGPQKETYWGVTNRERYNRTLESIIVSIVGLFFSYFLSFVVGNFIATVLGSFFALWFLFFPDAKARQRNWEFLGGRPMIDPWMEDGMEKRNHEGLFGSLLLARVDDVCVVEDTAALEEYDILDFQDYNKNEDEREQIAGLPYLLRMRISDDEGRELQIHARLSEEYLGIEPGMPAACILLSTSRSFSSLAALTDVYIPDEGCYVGDYPYLNRNEVDVMFSEDDDLWDILQSQSYDTEDVSDQYDYDNDNEVTGTKDDIEDDGFDVYDDKNDEESTGRQKIPVRRRRRR